MDTFDPVVPKQRLDEALACQTILSDIHNQLQFARITRDFQQMEHNRVKRDNAKLKKDDPDTFKKIVAQSTANLKAAHDKMERLERFALYLEDRVKNL